MVEFLARQEDGLHVKLDDTIFEDKSVVEFASWRDDGFEGAVGGDSSAAFICPLPQGDFGLIQDRVVQPENENRILLDAVIAADACASKLGWIPKSEDQRKIIEAWRALARAKDLPLRDRHAMSE